MFELDDLLCHVSLYLLFLLAMGWTSTSSGSGGGGRCGWHQMVVLSMILPGSFMIVFLLDRIETRRGRSGRHNHIVLLLLLGRVFKNKFLLTICKHNAQWYVIEKIKKECVCKWKERLKKEREGWKVYEKWKRDVSLGKRQMLGKDKREKNHGLE